MIDLIIHPLCFGKQTNLPLAGDSDKLRQLLAQEGYTGRKRKEPERLNATEDPRNRPLWYRKQLEAQRQQQQQQGGVEGVGPDGKEEEGAPASDRADGRQEKQELSVEAQLGSESQKSVLHVSLDA